MKITINIPADLAMTIAAAGKQRGLRNISTAAVSLLQAAAYEFIHSIPVNEKATGKEFEKWDSN